MGNMNAVVKKNQQLTLNRIFSFSNFSVFECDIFPILGFVYICIIYDRGRSILCNHNVCAIELTHM